MTPPWFLQGASVDTLVKRIQTAQMTIGQGNGSPGSLNGSVSILGVDLANTITLCARSRTAPGIGTSIIQSSIGGTLTGPTTFVGQRGDTGAHTADGNNTLYLWFVEFWPGVMRVAARGSVTTVTYPQTVTIPRVNTARAIPVLTGYVLAIDNDSNQVTPSFVDPVTVQFTTPAGGIGTTATYYWEVWEPF